MISVHVAGIGVLGPGLTGWFASRPILAGVSPYTATDLAIPPPRLLSPNERRRAGPVIRLAMAVADEAVTMSGKPADTLTMLFATAAGDGPVIHDLLSAVTSDGVDVSPTQFHNSVHNAAAGYWSIATGSREGVNCLGCAEATAAATLLAAVADIAVTGRSALVVVYDHPLPQPLAAKRPIVAPFASALVLTGTATEPRQPELSIAWEAEAASAPALPNCLETLRAGNDAARMLPLLALLAQAVPGKVHLPYLDGRLIVERVR